MDGTILDNYRDGGFVEERGEIKQTVPWKVVL